MQINFKINIHNFCNSRVFYVPNFFLNYMLNGAINILISSKSNQVLHKLLKTLINFNILKCLLRFTNNY